MSVDLSKLVFHSAYNAFKQNTIVQTGTCTITGTVSAGTNIQTFTVNLETAPDMVDIVFNGPGSVIDSRPDDAWFKQGSIGVPFTGPSDSVWYLYSSITGSTLTITAVYVQTFTGTETLTDTTFSYRVIDYSIF